MIEILVLQALANDVHGDLRAALVPLERALALAEPEGYVRTFVDEAPRIDGSAAGRRETRDHHGLRPATPDPR